MTIFLTNKLIFEYVAWYKLYKSNKPNSVSSQTSRLTCLARVLKKKPYDFPNVIAYLTRLQEENKKTTTLANFVYVLTCFNRYLAEKHGFADFSEQMPKIKVKAPAIEVLSAQEISLIMYAPRKYHTRRMKDVWNLMIELLARTGRRVSEVCELKVKDLDLSERSAMLLRDPKNGQARWFPIPLDLTKRLYDFCESKSPEDWVFASYKSPGTHLGTAGLRLELKLRAQLVGVTKRVNPHVFRHSFPVELLRMGIPLPLVSELMGHTDIKSTQRYIHLVLDDIRNAATFHPLNQRVLEPVEVVRSIKRDLSKYQQIQRRDIRMELYEKEGLFEFNMRW